MPQSHQCIDVLFLIADDVFLPNIVIIN